MIASRLVQVAVLTKEKEALQKKSSWAEWIEEENIELQRKIAVSTRGVPGNVSMKYVYMYCKKIYTKEKTTATN